MDNYPTHINEMAIDEYGQPLVCSGCAHSAADAPFPGRPSGERPCSFCTRNVRRVEWMNNMSSQTLEAYGKTWTAYYDNSPMRKCPMDCYISTDRIMNDVPEGAHIIT